MPGNWKRKALSVLPFNRINPILGIIMNHRDHRKIMVIDGKVAFSGGSNLADEYINVKKSLWLLEGQRYPDQGRSSLVIYRHVSDPLECLAVKLMRTSRYLGLNSTAEPGKNDGYIAPYGDTPFDADNTGPEHLYGHPAIKRPMITVIS